MYGNKAGSKRNGGADSRSRAHVIGAEQSFVEHGLGQRQVLPGGAQRQPAGAQVRLGSVYHVGPLKHPYLAGGSHVIIRHDHDEQDE